MCVVVVCVCFPCARPERDVLQSPIECGRSIEGCVLIAFVAACEIEVLGGDQRKGGGGTQTPAETSLLPPSPPPPPPPARRRERERAKERPPPAPPLAPCAVIDKHQKLAKAARPSGLLPPPIPSSPRSSGGRVCAQSVRATAFPLPLSRHRRRRRGGFGCSQKTKKHTHRAPPPQNAPPPASPRTSPARAPRLAPQGSIGASEPAAPEARWTHRRPPEALETRAEK